MFWGFGALSVGFGFVREALGLKPLSPERLELYPEPPTINPNP